MGFKDFFKRKENKEKLDKGLEKTKTNFFSKLSKTLVGKSKVDEEVLDDLEEVLIGSDVGVNTTIKIIERIEERAARDKYTSSKEMNFILKDEILQLMMEHSPKEEKDPFEVPSITHEGKKAPYVIMVVGVNGVGKTTTIGKLAYRFKNKGYKVLLGAGDTFRAAAVAQLTRWSERVGVDIMEKGMHTDPAAVAFETVRKGYQEGYDIVIVDTAGRLHNKVGLMNELTKIKKSTSKIIPNSPHEVLLVLDASTGQNAFLQAQAFTDATQVNALALTKLDGTAKGGVVIGVSSQFETPVKYIGVGEGIDDLQVFDPEEFINSLFGEE
ncbi:signal recognition particle-docking protein FtsY [bacterium]|nr:signal recognition particle-docking protein FtsY [bacterium]